MIPWAGMDIQDPRFQHLAVNAKSRVDLWTDIVRAADVQTMAEVGVWQGAYAKQILGRCDGIRRYFMIDPWARLPDWNKPFNVSPEQFADVYEHAMRETEFAASKRIVLRGRTREVIGQIPDRSLDLAYIDGDHTLRGITIDLISLLPKMREGGLVGGDDFTRRAWQHGAEYEPSLVCPLSVYFAEAINVPFVALPFDQFVLQVRSNAPFSFIDTTGKYNNLSLRTVVFERGTSRIRRKLERMLGRMRG
jgi:hypothetical protein